MTFILFGFLLAKLGFNAYTVCNEELLKKEHLQHPHSSRLKLSSDFFLR